MKKNESSVTSLVSAFSRAYHSQFDSPLIFDDFIAKDLITQQEFSMISQNMIQGIQFFNKEIGEKFKDNPDEILKWITQVQLSPTPLARAAFCEGVLQNELLLGIKQYVILGAGLDTFSFRHPELESSLGIYEVDHPATQEFKKKRVTEADLQIPSNLHFVPMDFTNDFNSQKLLTSGFQHEKTFFSFLGVTYYLSKEENASLIKDIFSNVPTGSSIVFDFADENLFKQKGIYNRVEKMLQMVSTGGEPMRSSFTYQEIEKMLEENNLYIYEHLTPKVINDRYFSNRTDYLSAFETIHYIHAVKK